MDKDEQFKLLLAYHNGVKFWDKKTYAQLSKAVGDAMERPDVPVDVRILLGCCMVELDLSPRKVLSV